MRSGVVALVAVVGLSLGACAPAPIGTLLVTNESAETYYLVINTVDGGSAFYRIDPGARGLASLADADRPRKAVVLYSSVCDAVLGSSDDSSSGMVIGADGDIRFDAAASTGFMPPLPADARCRW